MLRFVLLLSTQMIRNICVKSIGAVFIISVIACISSLAHAECFSYGCDNERVQRLYVNNGGAVYIKVSGDTSQLDCTLVQGQFITLKSNAAHKDQVYSALLTAVTMDRPVARLRIVNGTSDCELNYIFVDPAQG